MNKTINSALQTGGYASPSANVVEIQTEGVLCASGTFEYWEDGDDVIWDE